MAVPQTVVLSTATEFDAAVLSYISRGFTLSSRTPAEAVLVKKKEFSNTMLILGLVLCVFPLLIYLIVYAAQSDVVVVLRLAGEAVGAGGSPQTTAATAPDQLRWSQDRTTWWNGTSWVEVASEIPPGSSLSDDHRHWWDGESWRVVQPGARHPHLSGR